MLKNKRFTPNKKSAKGKKYKKPLSLYGMSIEKVMDAAMKKHAKEKEKCLYLCDS